MDAFGIFGSVCVCGCISCVSAPAGGPCRLGSAGPLDCSRADGPPVALTQQLRAARCTAGVHGVPGLLGRTCPAVLVVSPCSVAVRFVALTSSLTVRAAHLDPSCLARLQGNDVLVRLRSSLVQRAAGTPQAALLSQQRFSTIRREDRSGASETSRSWRPGECLSAQTPRALSPRRGLPFPGLGGPTGSSP